MSENDAVTYADALPPTPPTDAEPNDDDLAALLAKRQHAKPNRLTWVLLTVLVLMVGFIGGAVANQKFGTSSSGSGTSAGFPAGFPGAGSFPGVGSFPGAAQGGSTSGQTAGGFGNATFGTVKLVDGTNLYVTTAAGETVKVKVPASAKVTSQQSVGLADLPAGATVIIRGDKATDGTVTATTVSEGALPGGGPPAGATGTGAAAGNSTSSTAPTPGGN